MQQNQILKKGGRTIAQTPAPKKERIYGSKQNKPESSKDTKSAEKIVFNEQTLSSIKNKVAEHNKKHPNKKIPIASAKAVVRRGMGAYSSTHRPTIKGGKPNSRVAWGLARLNAFIYKIVNGKSKSGKYSQDDDLIEELGYKVAKYSEGGFIFNFKPIENSQVNRWFSRTSEFNSEFVAKNGKLFYISFNKQYLFCKVYDAELLVNSFDKGYMNGNEEIASAVFQINLEDNTFKGFEENTSIVVNEKYKRIGIATAITDYSEYVLQMKYIPSNVLTTEMQGFVKNRFEREKGGLIARNGKPSNLTPQQYKLVRTKAFKDWFGDWENDPENSSKVVDENGEPLVCYHSSNKLFNKFDYNLSYDGAIWFTENLQKLKDNEAGASGSGIIYKVFLNIRKLGNWDDYDKGVPFLLNDKFNGAKLDDDYIVFEPEQIKLADGSNTTFDSSNNDIRFNDGGTTNDIGDLLNLARNGSFQDKMQFVKENPQMFLKKGGLIAPNGKPSNLTPLQYKLVRTPEFKGWFGDWENNPENSSKVVDENGEPLVVYHGTPIQEDINVFDERKVGSNSYNAKKGFYFSDNYEVARSYTFDTDEEEYSNNVISVFLNARKIVIIDGQNKLWFDLSEEEDVDSLIKDFLTQGYDGVLVKNITDAFTFESNDINYFGNNYIVLNPNQIKLANGTNTTFDSMNSDIRFAKGGGIGSYEKPNNIVSTLQTEIDNIKNNIISKADISNEIKEKLKKVRAYVVQSARGWARYRKGFFSVPLWAYDKQFLSDTEFKNKYKGWSKEWFEKNKISDGYFIYYVAHELAHWLCWFTEGTEICSGHNKNFYDAFKKLCPYEYQHYELAYIKGSKKFGIPTYDQCIKLPAEEQTPQTEHCGTIKIDTMNSDIRFNNGGQITTFTEFYDNLVIEDGSKYIGQKFKDVFPFIARRKTPHNYRIEVKLHKERLNRLKEDKYTTPAMRSRDLNKLDFEKKYLRQNEYLASFILDQTGTIIDFKKDNNTMEKGGGIHNEKTIRVNVEYLEEQFYGLNKQMDVPISVYKQYQKTGKVPKDFIDALTSQTGEENWMETNPISVHLTPINKMEKGGLNWYGKGGIKERFAEGGQITQYEIEAMRNYINSDNPNPKLKESFEKVLRKFGVDLNTSDLSKFPKGKYIDTYDFSGYEYMSNINEQAGVFFLLTGEYQLVSKAIYEKDYSMWLFYNYLGRINISLKACQDWLNQAQEYFESSMPIPIYLIHTPRAKDGRSYAMWCAVSEERKEQAQSRIGRPLTYSYKNVYYYQEIGLVGNYDYNNDGWGTLYKEKKTGLLVPEYTETSFHFTTLIHEFAHCLDFQTQLLANIEKFEAKTPEQKEAYLNTENMTEAELALYSKQLKKEALKQENVANPITNHFEEFVDSLIRILRACAGGHIPLTQLYEQQALDVQQALAGKYGDLLLEQREKRAKEAKELAKEEELRDNKRFSWQSSWIYDIKEYVIQNSVNADLKAKISSKSNYNLTLIEALELDNLITGYYTTEFKKYMLKNPTKATQRQEDIKELKKETNRIINNHYDNIKSNYRYGFNPQSELELYIRNNCDLRNFRDYKSWKECAKEKLQAFQ